jgi:hypothetical protein
MNKKIIVDTSGSMNEEGKSSVIKSILFAVERFIADSESDDEYEVILLNEDAEIYAPENPVKFKGSINDSKLKDLLAASNTNIMFITDGNLSSKVIEKLDKCESVIRCVLLVGADANKAKLRKIVEADSIYETTDLITCLLKL